MAEPFCWHEPNEHPKQLLMEWFNRRMFFWGRNRRRWRVVRDYFRTAPINRFNTEDKWWTVYEQLTGRKRRPY